MSSDMFTVLAVFEAHDKMSRVLEKIDSGLNRTSETASKTATVVAEAGARIDESLLKTASGADAVEVADARLSVAQSRLSQATRQQAEAEQALVDVQRAAAAGTEDQVAADAKMAQAADALTAAQKRVAKAAKDVADAQKLQADTARAAAAANGESALAIDATAAAQSRMGKASADSAAGAGLAGKALNYGALAVAAVGYESIKAATSFQTLTTRLVTTAGEAPSALGKVQQGILQIATQTGTSADELAKSMYIVEAAGYDAAHGGLDVLKASTEGAKLEGSDFATVSNAVTDILKDYHLNASQSANVTSQLVAAVSSGKANFQQMSASMANILPLAASVHLKFADVAGVLATMTSHGVSAQRASQNIANALRSLEAPTGTMQKEFKALGISSDQVQQHLNTQGLSGTLQWLSTVAQQGAPKLGQTYPGALKALMGTAAGLNVALMTTGDNATQTAAAVARISKATADAHGNVSGYSQVQQTMAFKLDQAKASINNAGIALGTMLLPAVTAVAGAIANVLTPMASWISQHQKVIGLLVAIVGPAFAVVGIMRTITMVQKAWAAAQLILNAAMDANPIGLIVIALAALVGGFVYAWTHFKGFRDFWIGAWDDISGAATTVWNWLKSVFNFISNAVSTVVSFVSSHWQLLLGIITGPIGMAVYLVTHYWKQIQTWFEFGVHAALTAVNWLGQIPGKVWGFLTDMAGKVKQGLDNAVNWFAALPGRVWTFLSQLGTDALNIGVNFMQGLWNGLVSMSSWLYNQVMGLVKNVIPGPILHVLGIASPSKWAHWAGQMVGHGLANGITSTQAKVMAASTSLAQAITQTGTAAVQVAGAHVTGALTASVTMPRPAVAGAGLSATAGGSSVTIVNHFDLKGALVSGDAAMNQLADKVGQQIVRQFHIAGHKAVVF